MTNFDLEQELMNMMHNKSEAMPHAVDSDPVVVGRARRRRSTKLAALGGGSVMAVALVVGLFAINGNRDEVKIKPAPPGPTTEDATRVLDRGAIVASRGSDAAIVQLDAQGNEVRELARLPEYGAVLEIDPHPNGNELYVRVAEEESCGQVVRVDLESGQQTEIGEAAGVALSGNGAYAAFSTNLVGTTMTCGDVVKSVVLRDLSEQADLELVMIGVGEPDGAVNVTLNHDATRFVYEQCWERCVLYAGEFEAFDCFTVTCDRDVPSPADLLAIQGAGVGASASVIDPGFVDGRLFAIECDCEFESEQAGYRLAEFDPVLTGDRLRVIAELSDDQTSWAMPVEGSVLESTSNGTTLLHRDDESTVWSGSIGEIAVVPGGSSTSPTGVPTATTTAPTTIAPSRIEPLAPGAIVAARADGVIVELDQQGNEVRELYDAGGTVAEIDVVPGGESLLVRLGERSTCGQVSLVELATGDPEILGTAAGVAVSGDGQVVAMSSAPNDGGQAGCSGYATAVMVQLLETRTNELVFPYTPDPPQPDYAVSLALNFDGSMLTFEQCWEGCITRLAEVPVQCLDNSVDCDLAAPPSWDDMTALQHDGSGYGAGAYFPKFQGEVIIAAVCDCEVDAPSANYRVAVFDAMSGEQLNVLRDLPDGVTSLSVEGDSMLVGFNATTLVHYTDEPFTFSGDYTTATMVPVIVE